MDRAHRARESFLFALLIGLFAQPLDIFQFNQRGVGTAVLSPWQKGISAAVSRVKTFWCSRAKNSAPCRP
jgi:hypothetical protein